MILTVTLNPALHVQYEATRVELGTVNDVSRVRYRPGGRGLAVARLLHTFGHEVVAAGLAGGSAGELIRNELAKAGVATQFTRIGAESRRVVQVASGSEAQITSFAEPSPFITTEELGRLAADYRSLLDGATAVVLCGSLPAGLPAETYGSLVSFAAGVGVPVVLDAGGSALRHGALRRPALIVPELEDRCGQGSDGQASGRAAVGDAGLVPAAGSSVVLPASQGVRVLTAAGEWRAALGSPEDVTEPAALRAGRTVNTAGAVLHEHGAFRDALIAGLVPGIALAWSWPDTLRHALALAAAAVPGGEADLVAYEELLGQVEVRGPGG